MDQTTEKNCQRCGRKLHGRLDKRFCGDGCRNNFNRERKMAAKIADHKNVKAIQQIIKKNYEILKRYDPPMGSEREYRRLEDITEILDQGFNPKFFTSIYKDKDGHQYHCVYDCCYVLGEQMFICRFPEQAEI